MGFLQNRLRLSVKSAGAASDPFVWLPVEDEVNWRTFCARAAEDPRTFAGFRSEPICRGIVETVTPAQAETYLVRVLGGDGDLSDRLLRLVRSDRVGGPPVSDLGRFGQLSPTALRYASYITDMAAAFDMDELDDVVEIGGGYGGLCRMLTSTTNLRSYTIIDLPEVLQLIRRYLEASEVDLEAVRLMTLDEVASPIEPDLAISTFAYSELQRDLQRVYFDRVLRGSRHGFLMYNHSGPRSLKSQTAMELVESKGGEAGFLPEAPLTHPLNIGVVW